MVKDHSDSERKPAAASWDTLFPISSKGSFIMNHLTDRRQVLERKELFNNTHNTTVSGGSKFRVIRASGTMVE